MDRLLRNSTVVKIIALILAIILWFIVGPGGSNDTSTTYSKSVTGIPVTVMSDPNQVIVSNSTTKVNAILSGGTFDITQIQTSFLSIKAVADIRGYTSGTHDIPLTLQNVPDTVHYQIIPDTISITIAQKQSKTVAIKVGVIGQPGTGFVADTPIVSQSNTTVSGPDDAVARVTSIQALVSIDGAQKTVQENVSLIPVDQSGTQVSGVELGDKSVQVKVPVHAPTRDLLLQARTTGNVKSGYMIDSIVIDPDHATISGNPSVLGSLDSTYTLPPIDISGQDHDKVVALPLQPPKGTTGVKPDSVTVTVKIVQAKSTILSVPITLTNIPDSMTAAIQGNATAEVTVSGNADTIANLGANAVHIQADLSGLDAGTHTVALKSTVSDGLQVQDITPTTVTVLVLPK